MLNREHGEAVNTALEQGEMTDDASLWLIGGTALAVFGFITILMARKDRS